MVVTRRQQPTRQGRVGTVIAYPGTVRYPTTPEINFPEVPAVEIRPTGPLGWGANRQDVSHERRLRELMYLGHEVRYAEAMGLAIELKGIQATGDAMRHVEDIVYAIPQESVAAMVAADLASEMAARSRVRHARLMETYDAEAMNVIHRR